MRIRSRSLLAAPVILGGIIVGCPQDFKQFGLDVWTVYENDAELRRNEKETVRLDHRLKEQNRLTNVRMLVAHEVIQERLNLADATEQYLELGRTDPENISRMRDHFPAESERVAVALQVIRFVEAQLREDLRDEPYRREVIISRLHVELATLRSSESEQNSNGGNF